jgi:hypothetical protein
MRRVALWIFGLLAAGIFGALVGDHLSPHSFGGFYGFIGGMFAFACVRLWLAEATSGRQP